MSVYRSKRNSSILFWLAVKKKFCRNACAKEAGFLVKILKDGIFSRKNKEKNF